MSGTLQLLNISRRKAIFSVIGCCLLLIALETYALYKTFGFSITTALMDTINFNLLIATAGYITHVSMRYYQPNPRNAIYLIIWDTGLAILVVLAHNAIMINHPLTSDESYVAFLSSSLILRVVFSWLMITIITLISWAWSFVQDLRAMEKRESDNARLARDAELATLRQQLQPHFLFNSLNSISALAGARPEQARKMIQQLSDFLRGTIRKDQQMVSLQEELSHLELYLEIEKVRFGHRLRTEIAFNDAVRQDKLPSLLLQPIVENAIKFGLYDTTGEICIRISAAPGEHQLILKIENPFDPATSQPRQGTGFGLSSVQRRLYLLYGRNDLLSTRTDGNTFITEMKVPQTP